MADTDLVTIVVTDWVDSTATRSRLGEERADELQRVHDRLLRESVAQHDGTVVKGSGDGVLATFHSATQALDAAVTVQQRFDGTRGRRGRRTGVAPHRDLGGRRRAPGRRHLRNPGGGKLRDSSAGRAGSDPLLGDGEDAGEDAAATTSSSSGCSSSKGLSRAPSRVLGGLGTGDRGGHLELPAAPRALDHRRHALHRARRRGARRGGRARPQPSRPQRCGCWANRASGRRASGRKWRRRPTRPARSWCSVAATNCVRSVPARRPGAPVVRRSARRRSGPRRPRHGSPMRSCGPSWLRSHFRDCGRLELPPRPSSTACSSAVRSWLSTTAATRPVVFVVDDRTGPTDRRSPCWAMCCARAARAPARDRHRTRHQSRRQRAVDEPDRRAAPDASQAVDQLQGLSNADVVALVHTAEPGERAGAGSPSASQRRRPETRSSSAPSSRGSSAERSAAPRAASFPPTSAPRCGDGCGGCRCPCRSLYRSRRLSASSSGCGWRPRPA